MESGYEEQFRYISKSPADTERLAAWLARRSIPGTVIGLDGDLGAGKTAFSQGFAKHIGISGVVNSPTFTIIKEYEGRLPLYHMDVYRLSLDEADELGLDEYFFGEGVCLVEWSSLISELLPEKHLHISIETTNISERVIIIKSLGEPYGQWCRELNENGVNIDE
ncbi:tRNA (adenosine(37)-N6)-threonylcarbamoyltransferase complex ATPase subunit type 1 TsaE [Paenibacillus sp. N3/727]|uniref:tRNA (adenosine(37)-N6)-threonylcarbamoyltransferase complex ATPase subunit type 1 TsaE n=1 Tax=Paenibacillus sp. N3/727 TaxID=2925845 RepID=UPI001F5336DD|nr:tRNA (adenosine(37)-N6)-threonylcarbamoyltransferase complex ATPase subunit type 1 TsaE [Paenibacillus sp. N3/727]UNK21393.1 tRNA (adenosine(37)-N6)-threonylcarbamoyltransferase complex ATPase subunit type 1 TsaE [Paenibacillus sp. N3/727]